MSGMSAGTAAIEAVGISKQFGALRALITGLPGNAFVGTVAAAALLGTAYFLLGSFPTEYMHSGLRAARSSVATLLFVLLAAAAVQIWILARGRDWRPALRLVEAAGLVVAAVACAANYAFYIA